MHITKDGKFVRSDAWREGKWLDLWSVVHFNTGISTALGIAVLHFGLVPAAIIACISFIMYEMWEAMVKIQETPQNRFMDVVVGMASYVPTAYFLAAGLTTTQLLIAFVPVLFVNIALARVGWQASHKADVLEAKLRQELTEQREKIRDRRKQRKARRAQMRAERKISSASGQRAVTLRQPQPPEVRA
jgi:hypothetical protein